ncbi:MULTISPECIES: hypothetical protein [unclassified Campylobacter]|uniref:hypothetical protein n=1 Tax=unclassified Campylobacter TaxID=2593542 RepID=UPI001BD9642E|nr:MULTISPECIES: hypothetical protein [unclassified Campylobacter]MBT0880973.1 hypothetical protein [Campylobacter sp. 2018MI27]MBT0883825.1 hypothetical protein [Campylobacter sp. 2018MI10]MBZ7993193.1 hypothetical protein [Campylobacter sp. RM9333]
MRKIIGLSLITLSAFAYKPDYQQIFLPTPAKVEIKKQEFAKDIRFILDEKATMLDENQKQIGTIYEGTMVKLIETKEDLAKVSISGEVVGDKLAFNKNAEFVYLESKDAKPEMSFWVKSSSLTTDKDAAFEGVEVFYYDSCTSCHAAHAPSEHAIDEWDAYLGAMQMNAKITDEQKDRILRYMQAHSSNGAFK